MSMKHVSINLGPQKKAEKNKKALFLQKATLVYDKTRT